jgi:hypothetical protein
MFFLKVKEIVLLVKIDLQGEIQDAAAGIAAQVLHQQAPGAVDHHLGASGIE